MSYLLFSTFREAYSPEEVKNTMTVAELIEFLSGFDEDMPVILGFDGGYTYGGVTESRFDEAYPEDGDDWE